jgi:hypothetical protein
VGATIQLLIIFIYYSKKKNAKYFQMKFHRNITQWSSLTEFQIIFNGVHLNRHIKKLIKFNNFFL